MEPLRRELHAHCYRMLGSTHDADDALQDALLRAWRGLARFEGRSSLRSWLYTVATRTCLDTVETRGINARAPCTCRAVASRLRRSRSRCVARVSMMDKAVLTCSRPTGETCSSTMWLSRSREADDARLTE